MPAKNEAECLRGTLSTLSDVLMAENIPHEILVINDVGEKGDPGTSAVIKDLNQRYKDIRLIDNPAENHGLGKAIAVGLEQFKGDCLAIVMADGCDDPRDVVRYYHGILEGYDCVFGDRFMPGGEILNYPRNKLIVNRIANWFLAALFFLPYRDFTNAFKMYSRRAIQGIKPVLSPHFGITVELPLKAIVRGYSWKVVPNRWDGKHSGVSNLHINRMASRYVYIALILLLERLLVRSDYARKDGVRDLTWHAS